MMDRRQFTQLLAGSLVAPAGSAWSAAQSAPAPEPKFSVMLWTLSKLASFDQSLGVVAHAGFQGVELVGEFHDWDAARRKTFLARLASLQLRVDAMSGVSAGFAVPEQTTQFQQEFAAQAEAAEALGCQRIILLSGPEVKGLTPEVQTQCAVENLKRAGEMAAAKSLEIVIEPIDRLENPTIFLNSVQRAFSIVGSVNRPNVNVLYDFYHQQREAGDLIETLESHPERVKLVHIADVPGRHEPGTGEIDYRNVYAALAGLGYADWIAMEFYPTGDPATTLRRAREDALQVFQAHRRQG